MEATLPDDLVDLKAAARLAKCNLATCYRWVLKGRLRAWRRVGRLYVSRAEVLGLFAPVETRAPAERLPTRAQTSAYTRRILREMGL